MKLITTKHDLTAKERLGIINGECVINSQGSIYWFPESRKAIAKDNAIAASKTWQAQGESGYDNSISSHSQADMVMFSRLQFGMLGAVAVFTMALFLVLAVK